MIWYESFGGHKVFKGDFLSNTHGIVVVTTHGVVVVHNYDMCVSSRINLSHPCYSSIQRPIFNLDKTNKGDVNSGD